MTIVSIVTVPLSGMSAFITVFSSGFGLAVVKWLVEALKGKIYFESKVGKGTKFIIQLQSMGK